MLVFCGDYPQYGDSESLWEMLQIDVYYIMCIYAYIYIHIINIYIQYIYIQYRYIYIYTSDKHVIAGAMISVYPTIPLVVDSFSASQIRSKRNGYCWETPVLAIINHYYCWLYIPRVS